MSDYLTLIFHVADCFFSDSIRLLKQCSYTLIIILFLIYEGSVRECQSFQRFGNKGEKNIFFFVNKKMQKKDLAQPNSLFLHFFILFLQKYLYYIYIESSANGKTLTLSDTPLHKNEKTIT